MTRNTQLLGPAIVAALALALAVSVLVAGSALGQGRPTPTPTPAPGSAPPFVRPPTVTPVPVTRDFASSIPERDKWVAVIHFLDGHEERWLMPSGDLNAVQAQLPAGATVLSLGPPASLMGQGVGARPNYAPGQTGGTGQPPTIIPAPLKPLTTPVVGG